VIFFDTSAIYALADVADPNHNLAMDRLRRLTEDGEALVLHSYVLVEAAALLQHRLGLDVALRFLHDSQRLSVHWIGDNESLRAVQYLEHEGRRDLSLVDCASFTIMRQLGVGVAFAFDADFLRAGFTLYSSPA
jgi:uncharacterized protein